jgi:leucyl/phenylalanyl-tRNA--protein transferase
VIDGESLHVSRRLARELRQGRFTVTMNRAFDEVMRECGREREDGTWILPEMVTAYTRLHELGHAHSVETWLGTRLVGGLYGVQRGGLFAAESMFHRETSASKIALVACVRAFFAAGIRLFDVQFVTPHLATLGAYELSRREYLRRLSQATTRAVMVDAHRLAIGKEPH